MLQDHPRLLEAAYRLSKRLIAVAYPPLRRISPRFAGRLMVWGEQALKGPLFGCRMCGQCVLHSTGMTCPMTCPKHLRNGPCGGVRPDGTCEVVPTMPCIWVQAWERSAKMAHYRQDIHLIQPPLDRALQGTSAWVNMLEGRDVQAPEGWSRG
ncbi:MAG TPA: methylenetetrahydrofolate reductase C-terminal domain-containing protein [Roseiflexaceae bacterium]|nr:methylenetetrahydrofolate reductase C-terminal domain-containing protein [Roseiflexaceae bacterium]